MIQIIEMKQLQSFLGIGNTQALLQNISSKLLSFKEILNYKNNDFYGKYKIFSLETLLVSYHILNFENRNIVIVMPFRFLIQFKSQSSGKKP